MAKLKVVKGNSNGNTVLSVLADFFFICVAIVYGIVAILFLNPKEGGFLTKALGVVRLMFYTWLLYATIYTGTTEAYPWVSWGHNWSKFTDAHGLWAFVADCLMVVFIYKNLMLATGFSHHPSASNIEVNGSNTSEFGRIINFVNANLRQESNNGGVHYLSKILGGKM